MPTVIDSLVVELGLDPSKLNQGQQEAINKFKQTQEQAKKSGDLIEQGANRIVDSFSKVQRTALGVGALLGVGLGFKQIMKDSANADAATGRFAYRLQETASTINRWRNAARLAGGTADGFDASIRTLSEDLSKFQLTGESGVISYFRTLGVAIEDSNGKVRSMTAIMFDAAKAIEEKFGGDPAKAASVMKMIGVDDATINLLIRGQDALKKLLDEAGKLSELTPEQTENASKLAKAWERMAIAAENMGRNVRDFATPALLALMDVTGDIFNRAAKGEIASDRPEETLIGKFVKDWKTMGVAAISDENIIKNFREHDWGARYRARLRGEAEKSEAPALPTPHAGGTVFSGTADKEAFIRSEAARRGINPDIAMRVARSEGFNRFTGDDNSSFGAFQLHYGGRSKMFPRPGLGDDFTAATGLDASDPKNEKEAIRFALDEAKKRGWGKWMGAKANGITGFDGIGGGAVATAPVNNSRTSTTTIGAVNVYTQATDAAGIGRDIRGAIERNSTADQAQTGPN